jgi:predicted amidohydrolase YtcJ
MPPAAWVHTRADLLHLISRVPPPGREEIARALKWALDSMVAQGITSLADAAVTELSAQAYADLADRGELRPRVRGYLTHLEPGLISRRAPYARDRFFS